jgi:dimethylhistidine N-methyltransferase
VRRRPSERFRFIQRDTESRRAHIAEQVRAGLTAEQKRLPCCLFYDREGSRLFEEICRLPEYYLTRAERAILATHAHEIPDRVDRPAAVIELGSGNSEKTRLILSAFLAVQGELEYVPVDICSEILHETTVALLSEYERLRVTAVAAEYADGLEAIRAHESASRVVLWLGSNVGNFDRDDAASFVRAVRGTLRPRDRFVMGVDRRKSRDLLEPAYDDAAGVTAAFNLNLLERLNRDFAATFDLGGFRHRALYDEERGRVEMHLVSQRAQCATVGSLGLTVEFTRGETIHTESSYKYSDAEIDTLLAAAGMQREEWWEDPDQHFRVVLARPGVAKRRG